MSVNMSVLFYFFVFFFMGAMGRQDFRPIWLPTTATLCNNFGIYCIYYIYHWHVVNKLNLNLMARLRLIRDRFIAGHSSCELQKYLDSVPPETPIRV